MNSKNIVLLLLTGVISVSTAFAQHHKPERQNQQERHQKPDPEKFKAMKIAYLTEKISLTPAEAEKFWPVYNEYESKKNGARKEFREGRKEQVKDAELSDAEIEKMINQHLELKQTELNLEKEYLAKYKTILPINKVADLYKAEEGFKRDLLRKMKNAPAPPAAPTAPKPAGK